LTWDANVEGAVGAAFLETSHLSGFGRVRGGLLYVNESDVASPLFAALGLTYEISDRTPATFGVQGEIMSLSSGFWLQAGAMVDVQPRPGFMASAGWSLFGVEGQARWDKDYGHFFAVYGKFRVPIGVLHFALNEH
jgi:hypothetical protein